MAASGSRGERRWLLRLGTGLAVAAFAAALAAGVYLMTFQAWGLSSGGSGTLVNGTWVTTTWQNVPERDPGNEAGLKVWAAILVLVAGLGLVAALRRRLWSLLVIAGLLSVLSVLGMWSIGLLVAPTALLLLLAFFALAAGAGEGGRVEVGAAGGAGCEGDGGRPETSR